MLSREQIEGKLRSYLEDMFEIPAEKITLQARLYEDLDLDSIDAVDLVVKLQELTGRKLKVDEFKSVRSVGDVIDRVHAVLAE
ncbi:MAG: acyl carrier protein [Proteobacteria bacterium]|nr:acyl carrier protein [Pseudomonadota bacterium]